MSDEQAMTVQEGKLSDAGQKLEKLNRYLDRLELSMKNDCNALFPRQARSSILLKTGVVS